MSGVGRVGDIGQGVCDYGHSDDPEAYITTFVSGTNTVITNDLPTAVVSTVGNSTCGHPTTALSGSGDVIFEDKLVHRVGDIGANGGEYVTVSGSSDVIVN